MVEGISPGASIEDTCPQSKKFSFDHFSIHEKCGTFSFVFEPDSNWTSQFSFDADSKEITVDTSEFKNDAEARIETYNYLDVTTSYISDPIRITLKLTVFWCNLPNAVAPEEKVFYYFNNLGET